MFIYQNGFFGGVPPLTLAGGWDRMATSYPDVRNSMFLAPA